MNERPGWWPDCGAHGCIFAENKSGQRTNGGCQCIPNDWHVRNAVKHIMDDLREAQTELTALRESAAKCEEYREKADSFDLIASGKVFHGWHGNSWHVHGNPEFFDTLDEALRAAKKSSEEESK